MYDELIAEIKKKNTMEKVIEMFRKLNYRFISTDFLKHLLPDMKFRNKQHEKLQWLIRLNHIAKIPTKDEYDSEFLLGIRFFDERRHMIAVYHFGEFKEMIPMEWKTTNTQNHKKKKVPLTFPDIMSIQDRIDWRKYHDKWNAGKSLTKDQQIYYFRMKPHIGNLSREFEHLS